LFKSGFFDPEVVFLDDLKIAWFENLTQKLIFEEFESYRCWNSGQKVKFLNDLYVSKLKLRPKIEFLNDLYVNELKLRPRNWN
jgi:hypothetical protein